jgi:ABC-type lipoprotein export system ATPase subunit
MVTHSMEYAHYACRLVRLSDGRLVGAEKEVQRPA